MSYQQFNKGGRVAKSRVTFFKKQPLLSLIPKRFIFLGKLHFTSSPADKIVRFDFAKTN